MRAVTYIPNYVTNWTDKYFHQSAFDVPISYPSKKVLNFFVHFKRPAKARLYRGVNRYNKDNREITSWTYDRQVAERYSKEIDGAIVETEAQSRQILLDTTYLTKLEKQLLGYDYKIDDREVLL
jgi:hypothetical protein